MGSKNSGINCAWFSGCVLLSFLSGIIFIPQLHFVHCFLPWEAEDWLISYGRPALRALFLNLVFFKGERQNWRRSNIPGDHYLPIMNRPRFFSMYLYYYPPSHTHTRAEIAGRPHMGCGVGEQTQIYNPTVCINYKRNKKKI